MQLEFSRLKGSKKLVLGGELKTNKGLSQNIMASGLCRVSCEVVEAAKAMVWWPDFFGELLGETRLEDEFWVKYPT